MADLKGKKIVIVATDYFEESELVEPMTQLRDMGAEVTVAAPHGGVIHGLDHVEKGQDVPVDRMIDELDAVDYDMILLPGGVVNADHLRVDQAAQTFVKTMAETDKPIAAICHAPWLLVSSGLVKGKKLTSYPTLADDIKNAGGTWIDQEVVVDGRLITSRKPADIPAFVNAIVGALLQP